MFTKEPSKIFNVSVRIQYNLNTYACLEQSSPRSATAGVYRMAGQCSRRSTAPTWRSTASPRMTGSGSGTAAKSPPLSAAPFAPVDESRRRDDKFDKSCTQQVDTSLSFFVFTERKRFDLITKVSEIWHLAMFGLSVKNLYTTADQFFFYLCWKSRSFRLFIYFFFFNFCCWQSNRSGVSFKTTIEN